LELGGPHRKTPWLGWLIAACFFLLFVALRTNDFAGVDGALRCLGVFFKGDRFHDNNHMLYPFWVGVWAKANSLLGIRAQDAIQYLRMTQCMNAFAASAVIGFLYYLIESVSNMKAAILGSLMFGFSSTVTLQATTSDEPVAGLFFATLSLAILAFGIKHSSAAAVFVAGFAMSAALASYEAMGTVVGAAILVCCFWPADSSARPFGVMRRLLIAGAGSAVGVLVVYGWAYASQGVPVAKMPAQFLALGGAPGIYTGPELIPTKVANTPFGLIQWLFAAVPDDYSGIRALLHHSHRLFWLATVLAAFAFIAILFFLTAQAWRSASESFPRRRVALLAGIALFIGAPLWYWGPNNPKMWLFPLFCVIFAVAAGWARGRLTQGRRRLLTACLFVCLLAEIARSAPFLVRTHVEPTPHLAEAAALSKIVMPEDWVVLDFDDVSTLWQTIWGEHANCLLFPASNVTSAGEWLERAKAASRAGHGRLLFVEILQKSRAEWDPFLGARVKIPFDFLSEYRKRAMPLQAPGGPPVHVWQYTPATP